MVLSFVSSQKHGIRLPALKAPASAHFVPFALFRGSKNRAKKCAKLFTRRKARKRSGERGLDCRAVFCFGVRWLDTALGCAGGAFPLRLLRLFVANLKPRKSQNARKAGGVFMCK